MTQSSDRQADYPSQPEQGPVASDASTPEESFATDSSAAAPTPSTKSATREWVEALIVALLLMLLFRAFGIQVYMVSGESMEPTLHSNERLVVNKFIYHFRMPRPGEIVVLKDPGQPSRELVKRVVAVDGERVEVRKGVVYINGEPLQEPYKNTQFTNYPDFKPITVPSGYVFVMGDNRGNSWDSRDLGPVERRFVDGKAVFMVWPFNRFGASPFGQSRVYEGAGEAQ